MLRALPALTYPSPVAAPHAPVVVPASMMPGAARVRGYEPHLREPLPLRFKDRLEKRPSMSRIVRR